MSPPNETPAEAQAPKRSFLRRQLFPTWAERKRTLRAEAWVFVIGSYVLIAFGFIWPEDFRRHSSLSVLLPWAAFMVRTLAYHLGLVLIVVAVVTAITRQRRLLAAAVPVALVAVVPTWRQCIPRTSPSIQGDAITVMSANLLMVNPNTEGIIAEIKAARPDVLLLQEYSEHWHDAIQRALAAEYPHARYVVRDDSFGTAVYSRRPFVGQVRTDVPVGSDIVPQMRAVIRIGNRDVAVYNIHLLPPRRFDYTIEAWNQFADLLGILAKDTLPVVLGGDFNFTEQTPNAAALGRLGFVDAQTVGGQGRGTTWPVNAFFRYLPGLRLDHIYLGGGLTCGDCRRGRGEGSDHRPVIARIGFVRHNGVP